MVDATAAAIMIADVLLDCLSPAKAAPRPVGASCLFKEGTMKQANATFAIILMLLAAANAACPPNVSFVSAPFSPISVGNAPTSIAVGDFNGDGILDFAVALSNINEAGIYLGQGDGTFVLASNSPRTTGGSLTIAVAAGDFNGDGKLDVLATDIPGGLTGLFNSISGSVG